jgi:glycosyltransferase involved in cell wall biosynthesis
VKILLWHGYLLSGSGSNVYTANLIRNWRKQRHDVLLMCQERDPDRLGDVDEVGDFSETNTEFRLHLAAPSLRAKGRCRLLRPHLAGTLPVYVYDDYAGFTVKTFVELSDRELHSYTERNVSALMTALRWFDPDVVITGHEVMGPYIAKLAVEETGHSFVAKLHGSGLEYAVKQQHRYLRYAEEGLQGAHAVVGGSRYMVQEAASVIPGWSHKAAVVNPGCDVDVFNPIERERNNGAVGYVGKLIAAKGVHHLLAALPLTRGVKSAVIVGYGGFEEGLRAFADALRAGDLERARRVAAEGETAPLPDLLRFLEDPPPGYIEAAAMREVHFTGRLEHGPLSKVLPTFDALAVPSVVPEAFGMVAAEAAAAGVLPVVPLHSGIGEAGAALEEALARPGFLTFDPGQPVSSLAAALDRVLRLPLGERVPLERRAVALARRRWAWDHVADELLRVALA